MRPFSLLVKPAGADCNLRCTYCFYLEKAALYPAAARHRMPDNVLEHVLRTFLATDQPAHAIGWQGGEPTLMGLAFFRRVTELQTRHARPGRAVSNGLQTNATLLDDDWARHLARHGFLAGVSVDGPPAIHNRYRVGPDGRGAHAAALRGLAALRRQGAAFNVLALVSQANVGQPGALYRYLRDDLGVLHHQYIECVETDDEGALRPYAIDGAAWGAFLCGLYDAWQADGDTRRVSVRLFESVVARLVDGAGTLCAMGRDCRPYLVVEHNGDIYPCDFYVEPALKLGNVLTHTWEALLEAPAYAAFGARKRQWHARCDACPHLDLCAGCCPKNRPAQGREPGRLSLLCEGWLRFFEHARPGFERLAADIRAERAAAAAAQRAAAAARIAASFGPQTGRNDPCPCGSGRKFKKCCGSR